MEKVVNTYNLIAGSVVAFLTIVFGAFWYIFATYFVLNVADWVTGWYKARRLKIETSKAGLKGIVKKMGYWVIILVAFLISKVFIALGRDALNIDLSFLTMIGWFTLATLSVNEARSILENLVECGYAVPDFLIKGLAVTQRLIKEKTDKIN